MHKVQVDAEELGRHGTQGLVEEFLTGFVAVADDNGGRWGGHELKST